jgi:colicin import membrane protein
MVVGTSTPTISLSERSVLSDSRPEKLPKWLLLSLLFHLALIVSLFIVPLIPSRRAPTAPIYTVDLVGGEKIGGNKLGTELLPPPKETAKKAASEPPAPPPEVKKEAKKEKVEKPEKVEIAKAAEKSAVIPEKVPSKDVAKKEPSKKEIVTEAKSEAKSDEGSLDSVRERLIQSAMERVKNRAENTQKTSKGDVISAGPGEGDGAAALGPGGRGGGVVKGMDYVIYQNRLLNTIKENWAWVGGQRSNLRIVVHFNIKENGEIIGLKVVQPSGDSSYDESVVRAVKKSSPLPPPPESVRKDFAEVELTFRPRDLGA